MSGDERALARLMTYIDNRHPESLALMEAVYDKTGKARRIGITGPPGAGKSTLTDKLIRVYRAQGKKVGVVAIDPSSPFSGGAVLGDRIRMQDHNADPGVFIRSLGSHGAHGGLSRATRDIVHLLDAAGYDVILIETVGVGQTELDIMAVAHTTLVVLVPESGDTIQTMKAGLMEIADIFVVNKSDRDGADRIFAELMALAEMYAAKWHVPVLKTVAAKNEGVKEVVDTIEKHAAYLASPEGTVKLRSKMLEEECLTVLLHEVEQEIVTRWQDGGPYSEIHQDLVSGKRNPYAGVQALLKNISFK